MLLTDQVENEKINAYTSKYEDAVLVDEVKGLLKNNGFVIIDDSEPGIELVKLQDAKVNKFEIDIIGRKGNAWLILELKSFHPHPFFYTKAARDRRFREQYDHFQKKITCEIIPFFTRAFASKRKSITMYQRRIDSDPSSVTLDFSKTGFPDMIIPVIVNRIRELPRGITDVQIINVSDLSKYLSGNLKWRITKSIQPHV